ncbi:biosynthetic-type acetolactate synthase large subunit [Alkalibaculum sp. M08DMB]|uniref:Acetolactate synthase n=2 Tax=Alkalibaculum sporogenes TaxID=2655001 RepID=A0A6A7K7D5_9FIRM|nr:biosynthetic-type acetolactate synthase large subunit [Alkalibaculum sporogenes]MPW25272.1 biosynthetic-type acetolactate synthase large subunit [Alkalibaculum sporogenes]
MSGAQILLECLKKQDVDTIFGYPGGAVIPLFDALYDEQEHFKIYRTAHEQGAAHAADGYSRTTGKTGVCMVTSGPGATNTVTGIATAYMDSVPMVVITGQVGNALLGKDSFQEIDITGVTMPITKHNILVRSIDDIEGAVIRAFDIANSDRPGPVLIDIPKDVFMTKIDFKPRSIVQNNGTEKVIEEEDALIVATLINDSKRPVIYAGGGVKISKASQVMVELAEKAGIPVVNTLMGLSTIDRKAPLSLGLVGMHGFKEANLAVTQCDLFIAIGARFSDRVIGKKDRFAPNAKIIHFDIDNTEIDKNMITYLSYICDIKGSLEKVIEKVEINSRQDWNSTINQWKMPVACSDRDFVAKNIIETINKKYDEEAIIVTDVGQHQMWTAQYWNFNQQTNFVTSGGLGTMGFGIGASIGSKIGNPGKPVILFIGDGGFRMTCNELLTIAEYKIPILIVLVNNSTLGMVRQWQKMFSQKRYMATDNSDILDYICLAKAYGIKAKKVDNLDDLEDFVDNLGELSSPILLECKVDKDDCVLPIVPPGEAIEDFIADQY